ncbi:hypothetical protein Hanom_Chr03g00216931 [Helianthus anomalus]
MTKVLLFLRGKMTAVCGPHIQTSVEEQLDQTCEVCKKKVVCFLTYVDFSYKPVVVYGRWWWVVVVMLEGGGRWWMWTVGGGGGGRWWVVVVVVMVGGGARVNTSVFVNCVNKS